MATILNNYSISGGDTTSSTFTSAGDCVTVEATTTNLSGVNSLIKIQSSDDQSTWKDIGQIYLGVGSDTYCNDPIKVTGIYIRCLLITNDSISGTITITASNGGGGGIPTTGTPYKALQYDSAGDIQETNILTDDTGILTLSLVNGGKRLLDDIGNNAIQISQRQLIADDGSTAHITWNNVLGMVFETVMANGSFANDAAAGAFGLTSGMPYYTNVAGEGILKIKL